MWRCNDELRIRAEELHSSAKRDAKHYIGMYCVIVIIICFELHSKHLNYLLKSTILNT